jgi:acetylglutamate kinase
MATNIQPIQPIQSNQTVEDAHCTVTAGCVVVKLGGNILESNGALDDVLDQLTQLFAGGSQLVIVHGAGPQINECLTAQGVPTKFESGLRVTDDSTMMAVYSAFGNVNGAIVSALQMKGLPAVGLHAEPNLFSCSKKCIEGEAGDAIDLGWVGNIVSTNVSNLLKYPGAIAVVSPMGWDKHWNKYNLNADYAATVLAGALDAEHLLLIDQAPPALSNPVDKTWLVPSLDKAQIQAKVQALIDTAKVDKGAINEAAAPDPAIAKVFA